MGIAAGDVVDIAFCPGINKFRGKNSVQLVVSDIRQNFVTRVKEEKEFALYRKYSSGENVTAEEAKELLPPRESFVAIWRYLKSHSDNGSVHGERTYLSRIISRVAGLPPNIVRFLICLEVFKEMELIDMLEHGSKIYIKLRKINGKVDLNSSGIIKNLRLIAGG